MPFKTVESSSSLPRCFSNFGRTHIRLHPRKKLVSGRSLATVQTPLLYVSRFANIMTSFKYEDLQRPTISSYHQCSNNPGYLSGQASAGKYHRPKSPKLQQPSRYLQIQGKDAVYNLAANGFQIAVS